jgi:hypothetical protein
MKELQSGISNYPKNTQHMESKVLFPLKQDDNKVPVKNGAAAIP